MTRIKRLTKVITDPWAGAAAAAKITNLQGSKVCQKLSNINSCWSVPMLTIVNRSLACLCLSKGYKRALLIRLSNSTEILFRKPFISRFLYCFAYIFFAYLNCSYVLAITGYNWLNLFRGLMKVCRTKNSNDPKPGVRVSSLWLWYYHWKLIFLRESCFTFIISLVIKKVWKSIECKIGLIQSSFWEWKENLISRY